MKKIERLLGAAVIGGLGILAVAVIHPPLAAQGPNAGANPRASAPAKTAAPSTTPAPSAAHVEARALGNAFSEVAKKSLPLVASIRVEARVAQQGLPPGFEQFFGMGAPQPGIQRGGGSGIVVRSDGHILTNNHVVENADRIDVRLHDGRTFRAQVVGRDPASDLAVIKIDVKNLPAAKFADSDRAEIGEWVVAIGSPFGLDYSVTSGVLSAKGRGSMGASEIGDYLQTDASINPGNSGG
ncbi:MAG: trypsin-like peptidase domain-containing protein, partial [Myxococcales bacterium]|nr:trypsin-like peptidase domain-containing protein [Myxococcales bacterium]